MIDHDPKPIDPVYLCVSQSIEAKLTQCQPTSPAILRSKRGRMRWTLPGNTYEQNEQIGINNVQGLFLEKFPEFIQLFPIDVSSII